MYDKELISNIIPTLSFKFPYEINDYAENFYFENYHKHTDFSNYGLGDSGEIIDSYIDKIKEIKSKCLFSGEHGWQGDHFAVYDIAEKSQLKYRHSSEVYWVKDRFKKDKTNCHMIIVAKTKKGRRKLNYILSQANIEGFYARPRIDLDLLLSVDKDDFIVTSACIAGWEYEDADSIWLKIADHFKENFFFEVQYHNTEIQKKLNKHILTLAEEHNIQIIAGLDSHYIADVGKTKRDIILKYKGIKYPSEEGWYMDFPNVDVVIKRFEEQGILSKEQIYRAIMNTNIFVNDCEEIVLDKSFKIPNLYKDMSYPERVKLYHSVLNDAYKKEPIKSKERVEGVRAEANEITSSGVVDYFLFNHRLKDLAINKYGGILTTTSRGSMSSFYTNKLLGFTTLDRFNSDVPIYPDRFIKSDRIKAGQMPDLDLNVATQEPFYNAAKELLGEHGCYPLMAIEKLKVKSAWQLYAGAHDVSPSDANVISKAIEEYEKKLKHTDDEDKDSINIMDFIPEEYVSLYNKSIDYQKIMINLKCHACGFLMFDGDIREEIGLISAVSVNNNKRTICACVQGGYLDSYGYVKDDFLIVDAVSLTYELFESIGKSVPTFEDLKEMVKDDSVWDIYEKGITCCVNQLENPKTYPKMMKYKAKNISELSSFIAAIRPGFAPLLNKFLNRETYTTGEEEIDNLLEDTAHWMLYQESIMKVLSFLGVSMGDTYGIIKSISKKKLIGEKKEKLKKQLKESWNNHFGNTDNFNNVWDVIESSAMYAFNAPHAYSMAGDSLYLAWFKSHYTAKFYEVAIDHYHKKNNKAKINLLKNEAIKYYGYKLGKYEFGKDNRKVIVDEETKTIYPNLSSIKGFSKATPELLYSKRDLKCNSFMELLNQLKLKKTDVEKLILIDYFHMYGKAKKLFKVYELYFDFFDLKEPSKEKLRGYGVNIEPLLPYCTETEKKLRINDREGFFKVLEQSVPDEDYNIYEQAANQNLIFDNIDIVDKSWDKNSFFICSMEANSKVTTLKVYSGWYNKYFDMKMWNSNVESWIEKGIMITIKTIEKKPERIPSGEVNAITGKKIYKDNPDKTELWIKAYKIFE